MHKKRSAAIRLATLAARSSQRCPQSLRPAAPFSAYQPYSRSIDHTYIYEGSTHAAAIRPITDLHRRYHCCGHFSQWLMRHCLWLRRLSIRAHPNPIATSRNRAIKSIQSMRISPACPIS